MSTRVTPLLWDGGGELPYGVDLAVEARDLGDPLGNPRSWMQPFGCRW
jgi:hypothetical protein